MFIQAPYIIHVINMNKVLCVLLNDRFQLAYYAICKVPES